MTKVLEYLDEKSTLETDPLMQLAEDGQLKAFIHDVYFEPMDTYREYVRLKVMGIRQSPMEKLLITFEKYNSNTSKNWIRKIS